MHRLLPILVAAFILLVPLSTDAQIIPGNGQIGNCSFITGEFDFGCIPIYIGYLVQLVFSFIGTICLIQIIWGGYEIAFGGLEPYGIGNKESGKKRISGAIGGLVFSVLVFVIVDMVIGAVVSGPA